MGLTLGDRPACGAPVTPLAAGVGFFWGLRPSDGLNPGAKLGTRGRGSLLEVVVVAPVLRLCSFGVLCASSGPKPLSCDLGP